MPFYTVWITPFRQLNVVLITVAFVTKKYNMFDFQSSGGSHTILPMHRSSSSSESKWKIHTSCAVNVVIILAIAFFIFNSYLLYNVMSGNLTKEKIVDCDKTDLLVDKKENTQTINDKEVLSDLVNQLGKQGNTQNPINEQLKKQEQPTVKSNRQIQEETFIDPYHKIPKKPFQDDEYMIKERRDFLKDVENNDKGCGHTLDRDYNKNPVRVAGKFSGEFKGCAVRCVGDGAYGGMYDVAVSGGGSTECPHTKRYSFTMENIEMSGSDKSLVGTTRLKTDVPVPYYSWAEYDYMYQPAKKTATAMLAVFISNCGATKRLQLLSDLMKYGVTVHSYGKCMNNAQIPSQYGGSYLDQKTALTATYKFTFAAENSETEDYVTEKLFGTLSSGSVPVYLGAPNARKFAPSPKSVIYVSDFASTKELADYLIELDKDDEKYNEYLKWKKEGPSKDFMAVVDRAIVHSSCRLCIRVADHQRAMYGNRVGHEAKKKNLPEGTLALQVRPRGEFYLRYVYLKPSEQNMASLTQKVLSIYKNHDPSPGQVYSIFRLWDRLERPLDDKDFKNGVLSEDMELEIIFTYPIHKERGKYYEWQKKVGKA